MVKSIRWRLQIWYSLVLIAVVSIFAGILYLRARSTAFREIDSRLEAAVRHLDAELRIFPPPFLDSASGLLERLIPKWKGGGKEDRMPRFGPRNPEEILERLTIPPSHEGSSTPWSRSKLYFGVWRHDGSSIKTVDLPEGTGVPDLPQVNEIPIPEFHQREGYREVVIMGPHVTRILVGMSTAQEEEALGIFAVQLAAAGLAVLLIGADWWVVDFRADLPPNRGDVQDGRDDFRGELVGADRRRHRRQRISGLGPRPQCDVRATAGGLRTPGPVYGGCLSRIADAAGDHSVARATLA